MEENNVLRQRLLKVAGILVVSAPLLIYLYGTLFIRYMADDFCVSNDTWLSNLWGKGAQFPITAGLIDYPIHLAGAGMAPLFCILSLVAWWCGAFLVLREIQPNTYIAILGASLLVGATLASTRQIYQSVYWQAGMVENLIPVIFGTYLTWLILQRTIHPTLTLIVCFVIALLAGTTANAYCVQQVVVLGLFWLALRNRPIVNKRLLLSAVAAVLALLFIVLSPGTQDRIESAASNPFIQANPQAISRLFDGLVRGFKDPLSFTLRTAPLPWLALLIIPFIAASYNVTGSAFAKLADEITSNTRKRNILILAALGLLLVAIISCMAMWAAGYVGEGKATLRTWMSGQYIVLAASAAAAYILGFVFATSFPSRLDLLRRYGAAIVILLVVASAASVAANGTATEIGRAS